MKKLKKFQKFALSTEQASKVRGGVIAICGTGAQSYIISASTYEQLQEFADEQCNNCQFVYENDDD